MERSGLNGDDRAGGQKPVRRGVRRGEPGLRGAAGAGARAEAVPFAARRTCPRCCGRITWITTNTAKSASGHDKALWAADDLPFRVEFFHPGYIYQEPVHINEFTLDLRPADPVRAGFFRLRRTAHPEPDSGQHRLRGVQGALSVERDRTNGTNWASFLGASYFRLLGKGQRYGASARGLAINCGGERAGGIPHLHRLVAGQAAARTTRSCGFTRCSTA